MNKQEVFNKVIAHMREQRRPAVADNPDRGFACVYREAGGRKCAIGALIPDEVYDEAMEGRPVRHILTNMPMFEAVGKALDVAETPNTNAVGWESDVSFLSDMQFCHDNAAQISHAWKEPPSDVFMAWFEDAMRDMANRWCLVYTPEAA